MRYRLLVLDVDGTLLDSEHRLRPRVADAVRAAQSAGMGVTLATGKLLPSVRPILAAMGIRGPQITLNGAATVESETGKAVRFRPLNEDDRRAIIATVRAADPSVLISHFSLDAIYLDQHHPNAGIFAEYGEGPPVFIPDLLAGTLPPAAKILLSAAPARLVALRAVVTPRLAGRVSITATTTDFLEFFAAAAGKGRALVDLRARLGLAREAIIAIGDGENDLPLLREAGLAVAMANGAAPTHAVAHHITASNDDEGVAIFLEALLRGEIPA